MKPKPRFYKAGLRFECAKCGNCCQLPGGKVFLNGEEIRDICLHLNLSFGQFIKTYIKEESGRYFLKDNEKGGCIFLEDNRCSIYSIRPNQCRIFPFWSENLKSRFRWKQLIPLCPGIGIGDLYSAEWIQHMLRLQKQADGKW